MDCDGICAANEVFTVMNNNLFVILSIIVYMISLGLTCYSTLGPDGAVKAGEEGFLLLILGWLGLVLGVIPGLPWLGNVFLLFTWITYLANTYKLSTICGILALFFASTFLLMDSILVVIGSDVRSAKIASYEVGYWVWLISISSILIPSVVFFYKNKPVLEEQKSMDKQKNKEAVSQ